MSERLHTRCTQVFFGLNSLFWLPWGAICVVWPKAWAGDVITGMDVFDLSDAVSRTEVRAMYGGLQMAVGVFLLLGAASARYRRSALVFFVIALTALVATRFGGMVAEGESSFFTIATNGIPEGRYNQAGLTMYELPNMLVGWVLLLLAPRITTPEDRIADLEAENARLRSDLASTSSTTG